MSPGRILVTGASGFAGGAVVEELARRGHTVHALVNRHELPATLMESGKVQAVRGSILDPAALGQAVRNCDAVIHLVGIIREYPSRGITFRRIHIDGTRNVIDAALGANVRRLIHMSALGTRPDARSTYHRTKFAAEQYVVHSALDWTIFRPSLIHGPRGEFMRLEARWARKTAAPFLFMPYFGAGLLGQHGAGRLQPVYAGDVARAFADALDNPKTIGEIYPLGGPDQFTWPELHKAASRQIVGKQRWTLPMPVWAARFYAAIGIAALLGFNRDQVIMSQEDNTCDLTKFVGGFGWEPRSFQRMLEQYASQL